MISSLLDSSRPWLALLIILPGALLLVKRFLNFKKPALVYSDIRSIPSINSFRTSTLFIPKILFFIAWCLLVIALIGPREGHEESNITTQGIAISMVMDISGSMKEIDMPTHDGKVISRYEMIQNVFTDFVRGNKESDLSGRNNDMISLTVFGKYVDDLCPLTLDHSFLLDMMNNTIEGVKADMANFENLQRQSNNNTRIQQMIQKKNPIWLGTAVFEGVALGADIVRQIDDKLKNAKTEESSNYTIKSKIMIVLTDGEDNSSEIGAEEAIAVAKELGVKIYSIAVHGKPVKRDVLGFFMGGTGKEYDDAPLQKMAEETGGKFYKASDPDSLIKIYRDINKLEKSEISKQVTMEFSPTHRPWILAGLIFLMCGVILNSTYYRILP
jgi:Ca-activated chloride channel family protein